MNDVNSSIYVFAAVVRTDIRIFVLCSPYLMITSAVKLWSVEFNFEKKFQHYDCDN